jgi:hypothetical protein
VEGFDHLRSAGQLRDPLGGGAGFPCVRTGGEVDRVGAVDHGQARERAPRARDEVEGGIKAFPRYRDHDDVDRASELSGGHRLRVGADPFCGGCRPGRIATGQHDRMSGRGPGSAQRHREVASAQYSHVHHLPPTTRPTSSSEGRLATGRACGFPRALTGAEPCPARPGLAS